MDIKRLAYLLVFMLVLQAGNFANAAPIVENTRYLVKSNSGFWKKSFGSRNEFKEGFTADLSDWQLRVAKVFKLEVVEVKKLFILQEQPANEGSVTDLLSSPNVEVKAKPTPAASLRPTPSKHIPWGISRVYNNTFILEKTSGGEDVNVAILDTGITKTHRDLEARVKECKDFTAVKIAITDGKCEDKNGHGTHIAGIIAADGGSDGLGIYGVAPAANLFAYKVCGTNGSCWSDDIAMAIKVAADQGANIINLSLGSDSESSLIAEAVSYAIDKDVLIIAAAGNDGPELGSIDYPAANPGVVAVGAFDVNNDIAEWSSRGINSKTNPEIINEGDIEFAAPGVIIESTWKDGGYVILSGTSMATPHVAGLAAKLWQKNADDPDSATREFLRSEGFITDLFPPNNDDASGFGFPHI